MDRDGATTPPLPIYVLKHLVAMIRHQIEADLSFLPESVTNGEVKPPVKTLVGSIAARIGGHVTSPIPTV